MYFKEEDNLGLMEMKSSDVDDININKKKWNRLLSMNENLELYLIF